MVHLNLQQRRGAAIVFVLFAVHSGSDYVVEAAAAVAAASRWPGVDWIFLVLARAALSVCLPVVLSMVGEDCLLRGVWVLRRADHRERVCFQHWDQV